MACSSKGRGGDDGQVNEVKLRDIAVGFWGWENPDVTENRMRFSFAWFLDLGSQADRRWKKAGERAYDEVLRKAATLFRFSLHRISYTPFLGEQ